MSKEEVIEKKVINSIEFDSVASRTERGSKSEILEKEAVIVSAGELSFVSTVLAILFFFLLVEKGVKSISFSTNLTRLESKRVFTQNR